MVAFLVLSHSGPSHLTNGLLQCSLHRATFEEHLKAIAGAECSCVGSSWGPKNGPCNITALWAALAAGLLPDEIKVLVITFNSLHGMGPGYIGDHLIPLTHPTQASKGGVLWAPLAWLFWLVGSRRRNFSAIAPVLWNILPFGVRSAPTFPTLSLNCAS